MGRAPEAGSRWQVGKGNGATQYPMNELPGNAGSVNQELLAPVRRLKIPPPSMGMGEEGWRGGVGGRQERSNGRQGEPPNHVSCHVHQRPVVVGARDDTGYHVQRPWLPSRHASAARRRGKPVSRAGVPQLLPREKVSASMVLSSCPATTAARGDTRSIKQVCQAVTPTRLVYHIRSNR